MYYRTFFQFLLFLFLLCVFVPFAPKMPAATLDASWALALNEAVAKHLNFGKDIIFTLGPYSSLYTKAYHPATDSMMLWGSMYLAFSYWLALWSLTSKKSWLWLIGFSFFILGMLYSRDSLLLSYPFLVGLLAITHPSTKSLPFLFIPFGLLILVKGTFLVLCLTVSLFSAFYLRKISCLIIPLITTLFFWQLAGQSWTYLSDYFLKSIWLIEDFSEAMALEGPPIEIIFYLISSVLLLACLFWQNKFQGYQKISLVFLFALFLFVSMKAGFVRHFGHSYVPASSIVLAALFLLLILPEKKALIPFFSAVICWTLIIHHQQKISISHNIFTTLSSNWHGFKKRLFEPNWTQQNFDLALAFLNQQQTLPKLSGSTDIYSYQQTYLFASSNQWQPRPIFQSYSVFSKRLAEANLNHLKINTAPQYIFFQIEAIDNRLPALEDGASWPWLLKNYHAKKWINHFLLLQKNELIETQTIPNGYSQSSQLGKTVKLPATILFSQIKITPTLWGRLMSILFKPSPLKITLTLKQGEIKHYRLIANMAQAGFFLSPLIETTEEFALFFKDHHALSTKEVVGFKVTGNKHYWKSNYQIKHQEFL